MKPLIVILMFAATLAAQTPTDKTFTIPDFKVTEQSLAKAQYKFLGIQSSGCQRLVRYVWFCGPM